MAEQHKHLRVLERAANEAQRILENRVAAVDAGWNDHVRRGFEADHLAAIRSDARLLRVEMGAVAQLAERALRELTPDR